jgi:histidinol-phosphate aminotransferase
MFDLNRWIVPTLKDAKTYGMELGELSVEHPEWARMCLNENPLLPSAKVVAALAKGGEESNRYPDLRLKLRARIGGQFGLKAENVFIGNGSSENIDSMMRAFLQPGDSVLLPDPTFSLFNVRASVAGAKIKKIAFAGDDLDYSLKNYLDAIDERTKLIVVVTPNNPTGSFFPHDDMVKLLEKGIPTCIDEAYLEFHPDVPNEAGVIAQFPNAFVSHTLSKAYGLAGIRFGYLLGRPEMVAVFEKLSLPWNISFPTLYAVEAALDDDDTLQRNIKHIWGWMKRYDETLRALGCRPIHPAGNFMLVDASAFGRTTKEIYKAGLEAGVILKTAGPINGKDGYFRLTPGSDPENERALAFMKRYFRK